jgi:hypothetical protein
MRRWISNFGLVGLLVAVGFAPTTQAATVPPTAGSPGQGLEISPPVIELRADPGQTVTAELRVRNVTKGELIAQGRVDDFGAGGDESGQPKLLLDETNDTRYSLRHWVRGVPDLDLAPLELKKAIISIVVP